jgi:hypothetical protein
MKAESYLLIMQTKTVLCQHIMVKEINSRRRNYKNVRLPNEVIFQFTNLPDYTIVNDKYLYTQEEGDILKNSITLKSKGRRMLKLTVRSNGDIVKSDKTTIKKKSQSFLASSLTCLQIN